MVVNYRFQMTLKPQVRERMDELAQRYGMSRAALFTMLINERWEKEGGKYSGDGKELEQAEE